MAESTANLRTVRALELSLMGLICSHLPVEIRLGRKEKISELLMGLHGDGATP